MIRLSDWLFTVWWRWRHNRSMDDGGVSIRYFVECGCALQEAYPDEIAVLPCYDHGAV